MGSATESLLPIAGEKDGARSISSRTRFHAAETNGRGPFGRAGDADEIRETGWKKEDADTVRVPVTVIRRHGSGCFLAPLSSRPPVSGSALFIADPRDPSAFAQPELDKSGAGTEARLTRSHHLRADRTGYRLPSLRK